MDYEKAYKEALSRANKYYNANTNKGYREIFEDIFPELRESEDEKIRNEIILYIGSKDIDLSTHNRWLTWLEKQGEKESKEIDFADWDILNYIKDIVREHVKRDEEFNEIDNWLTTHYQEQKPAWSEEDESMFLMCSDAIAAACAAAYYTTEEMNKMQNWLKSIKPNHWKPSEEQMEALVRCLYEDIHQDKELYTKIESLYNDLKNL